MRTTPWCIMPWTYLELWPTGEITPCCGSYYSYGNIKEKSLDVIWNDDPIKQLRLQMFEDEMPQSCYGCKSMEDLGSEDSLRFRYNKKLSSAFEDVNEITNEDGSVNQIKFKGWDFKITNKCNFNCRMCTPWQSSNINEENKKIPGYTVVGDKPLSITEYFDIDEFVEKHSDHLELIQFAGGETLIMQEQYDVIKSLIEKKKTNIKLEYNTNLSVLTLNNFNILDYWRQWNPDKLLVQASIDEVGERAEYIRKGTRWNVVDKNLKLISNEKFLRSTNTVVGCFNVFRLPELIQYLTDINFITERFDYRNFDLVLEIGVYSVKSLSYDFRQKIKTKLLKFVEEYNIKYSTDISERFIHIINTMDEPQDLDIAMEYLKETFRRDKVRNENTFNIIPELNDVKRTVKKYMIENNINKL